MSKYMVSKIYSPLWHIVIRKVDVNLLIYNIPSLHGLNIQFDLWR